MTALLHDVTFTCFGLSYLLALLLELAAMRWSRPRLRILGLVFGTLGLLTHSLYLASKHPTPAKPYGALLSVAWVLAIFYLYGALHYTRRAWAIFVLPIVLGLVGLAFVVVRQSAPPSESELMFGMSGDHIWGAVHGVLLLLASVGVCVGFIASIMYLIQARRLRKKLNPLGGMRLLNLERLEQMNRQAVNLAFPLLTLGLLLGAVLLEQYHNLANQWFSPKVLGTFGLWLVFLVLLYLRYAVHVPARRLAWFTILAFSLMVLVLVAAHPFAQAEGRS